MYRRRAIGLGILLWVLGMLVTSDVAAADQKHLQFAHLTVEDGLPQNTVHSIVRDKYGYMWFGTWNGLTRYDGYRFTHYRFEPDNPRSLVNNRVHLLHKDGRGDLWVATFDTIVCRYNYAEDDFSRFNPSALRPGLRDSSDRHNAHFYHRAENADYIWTISDNRLLQIHKSSSDTLIYSSGLFSEPTLSHDVVYSIYLDATGVLWVGTAMGGLSYADTGGERFHYMPFVLEVNQHLHKAPVRAVLRVDDELWLGSSAHGWARAVLGHNEPQVLQAETHPLFTSENVRALYRDRTGDVWLGYRMGLYRYKHRDRQLERFHPDRVPHTPFYVISEDPKGDLWVGGSSQLLRYERSREVFEIHELPEAHAPSNVMSLAFGQDGKIWVGTELLGLYGIVRDSVGGAWTDTLHYSRSAEAGRRLPDNRVYALCSDREGHIWVGTGNGLCRIDKETGELCVFNREHGLADAYIAMILPDEAGQLWVSHKRGISKVDPLSGSIENFMVRGGVRGYEFVDGSGFRDSITGRLYFGGLDGYVSFVPRELRGNEVAPQVQLTALYVNNEQVQSALPLLMRSEIALDYSKRDFALEFSAMHYVNPLENRYAWKLEGYDTDWVKSDGRFQRAAYSALAPGDYVFRVRAANSDGLWSEREAVLQVRILPPWWRSGWAYAVYVLLLLLSVLAVYYLFLMKWRLKHQIEMERFEVEKLREMQGLRTRFFTSISHELRTPLTLILDPVERLLNTEVPADDRENYLRLVQRNAHRLLRLLNQLLAVKRIEAGHEVLAQQALDLSQLLYAIFASFELKARDRNIAYHFDNRLGEVKVLGDADKLEKIFYNLLSNAFKYTPEGGQIVLELQAGSPIPGQAGCDFLLQARVRDNGAGMTAEVQAQIFELFYRSESASEAESSGVGLAYIRELVHLHKGQIRVESSPGKGSCFTVNLPFEWAPSPTVVQEEVPSPAVESPEPEAQDPGAATVLVVEDDPDIRSYLAAVLQTDYKVLRAADGREGFERALQYLPDLIVSDVVMPEWSGLEMCRHLRNDMRTCFIPVLMLTSLSASEEQVEGVESGADVYLSKPFQTPLLLAHVRRLLQSWQQLKERAQAALPDSKNKSEEVEEESLVDTFIQSVRQHIEEGVFDVQLLAEKLHLSRTQLYRKVKAQSARSVSELIAEIRMKYALELLQSGRYNVNEVADRLGYSEPGNFSRAFQKYYGKTPRSFMP